MHVSKAQEAFERLGDAIASAFRGEGFSEFAFPEVATSVLRRSALHDVLDFDDLATWLIGAERLPEQHDIQASFGNPPVTVYAHPRFYVQVLFWSQGETTMHYHSFTGAYTVLHGSSIEVSASFSPEEVISAHLKLGSLAIQDLRHLAVGDVRPIRYAPAHIVYHVERPTISLVVRTHGEATGQPQFACYWPGVAWNTFYFNPVTARKIQLLRMLQEVDKRRFAAALAAVCSTADLQEVWSVCLGFAFQPEFEASLNALGQVLAARFQARGDRVRLALCELSALARIRQAWELEEDETARWWLTGLLLCADRRTLRMYASVRYPGPEFEHALAQAIPGLARRLGVEVEGPVDGVRLSAGLAADGKPLGAAQGDSGSPLRRVFFEEASDRLLAERTA